MHGEYIRRRLHSRVQDALLSFPAVAVVGPRQCGKSTLAQAILQDHRNGVYLDLERPSDRRRLAEPELFLGAHGSHLVCLDEVQRTPELFPVLRSVIDARGTNGQFLIAGSASPALLQQSSESLAGRIAYLELTPFLMGEVPPSGDLLPAELVRGGFPRSLLAASEAASVQWRESFVRSFLERDIPALAARIPVQTLGRLWRMCAHHHGQLLNQSRLGESLGLSHTTVRSYLELLEQTFMVRLLLPLAANLKKRLVKTPRIYVRDTGILHSLLEIDDRDALLGHPLFGASWEGFVIENAVAAMPRWRPAFYRTSNGAELDLVLTRGNRRIGIEAKGSAAPEVTKGFWHAVADLNPEHVYVAAPVTGAYPLGDGVEVLPVPELLTRLASLDS